MVIPKSAINHNVHIPLPVSSKVLVIFSRMLFAVRTFNVKRRRIY